MAIIKNKFEYKINPIKKDLLSYIKLAEDEILEWVKFKKLQEDRLKKYGRR